MKLTLTLFLLLCISLNLKAQETNNLNDTGNIPFELLKEKIIVPIKIGNKTYRFLVDTGGIFEISEALDREYNFNQVASTTIVDINRIEVDLKTVIVPEIKLGNWTFKNRKAIVGDLHNRYPFSCFDLDGMIGRDFFDKVILQFDDAKKTFRITEDVHTIELEKENRTRLKLSSRGLPEVKIRINGKREFIEFDSGSGDFYSPKTSDVEKEMKKNLEQQILSFNGEFSFGVSMDNVKVTKRYMKKIERFQLANAIFKDFYSQFSKVSAPRIGANILKYGKVTLDLKNGWFYFDPYLKEPKMEAFETFGFSVAIDNNTYKIKWILVGSEAYNQGLRSGMNISAINGLSTLNLSEDCTGYLNGYAHENGKTIRITFIDDLKNEKTIELSKKLFD